VPDGRWNCYATFCPQLFQKPDRTLTNELPPEGTGADTEGNRDQKVVGDPFLTCRAWFNRHCRD
jgi:hypothetical protein